jgi:TolA-binding protein
MGSIIAKLNMSVLRLKTLIFLSIILSAGCAYFNTFYNAQNNFRQGKKLVVHDTLKVDSEFFDKTIEKTTSVIIKYPGSRYVDDALFMMGVSYYYKGDYRRALEKLDFFVMNYTDSKFYDAAMYYKGLAHYKQNKFAPAIIALEQAQHSKQYRVKAMIALCYVHFKDHNYSALTDVASELIKQGIDKKERRWLLRLLGESYFEQGQYADAADAFHELLSITRVKEDEREIKLKIAESYLEMGEYDKCKEFLEGQSDDEFKRLLADLNVKLGNITKAKELYFNIAINSNFDFASETFFKLAELYKSEDSLELAIANYDSAVIRAPMSEYGIKAKRMADILRKVEIFSKQTEETDRAQFLLAEIYFVNFNDPERAMDEYAKVFTEFPQSEWAPKAMYAQFWIAKRILEDDSLALSLARDLMSRYPNSEYARSIEGFLSAKEGNEGWLEE